MILGILSDTHDQLERTQLAVELLRDAGAETFIHCGDFVDASLLELLADYPCYFVWGNNDCDHVPSLQDVATRTGAVSLGWGGIIELADKQIAVTHGHLHREMRTLLAIEPDYLFSGHSHRATDERRGKTRCINPGALHRTKQYSVAVFNLVTDELQFLNVPAVRLPNWKRSLPE